MQVNAVIREPFRLQLLQPRRENPWGDAEKAVLLLREAAEIRMSGGRFLYLLFKDANLESVPSISDASREVALILLMLVYY